MKINDLNTQIITDYEAKGYHIPPMALQYKGKKCIISARTSDDISIYRDKERFYVYNENHNLNYAGVQMIGIEDMKMHDEVFIQGVEAVLEIPNFLNKSIPWKIQVLLNRMG